MYISPLSRYSCSCISAATPFNAKIRSNAFSLLSYPFLLATVLNWNLNTDRGALPSKQGRFILPVLSDTTRTGSGHWLWMLLIFFSIITSFPSTVFSKSFTFMSKCDTFSLTLVILLLTTSWIFCRFAEVMSSSLFNFGQNGCLQFLIFGFRNSKYLFVLFSDFLIFDSRSFLCLR